MTALLKGLPKVRIADSLSKLHDYIAPEELQLPTSTLSLEEDLKVNDFLRLDILSVLLIPVWVPR